MNEKVAPADAKLMYELSKLTNVSRQIAGDFVDTMVFTMFQDYIDNMEDGAEFLATFMDFWEKSLLQQKQIELESLTSQEGSMLDMAAGAIIANSENVDAYAEELAEMKTLLAYALTGEGEE